MKTLKNYFTTKKIIAQMIGRQFVFVAFICSLLITLSGCGKPGNNPMPPVVNVAGCAILSDIDEALGIRNFEYDDKGLLTKMTGPNYYYGPFVRTITPAKVTDAYPTSSVDGNGNHFYGTIKIDYTYSGGSGNIYDGNPQYLHDLFTATNPPSSLRRDSLYQFVYDDAKKHLTTVLITGNGSEDADGFVNFRDELAFVYDANENVTQVKIIYDWSKKTVVYPSGESHIDYKQISDELLKITYDDKQSPYAAIAKYWKFIGEDFSGFGAYNLDKVRFWAGRCAILSKNNPVTITGNLKTTTSQTPADVNAKLTYQYNEKDFPVSVAINGTGINSFTYKCN